jgi:uncharacterized damage-inducible protein DinB
MGESQRIATLVDDVFFGGKTGEAWHGSALWPLVKDLPAAQATKRAASNTHSIWELATHIANWNDIMVRRLDGEVIENVMNTEADWPKDREITEQEWQAQLARLKTSCERLRHKIAGLSDDKLADMFPNREYSHYQVMHGIMHHIIYHTGQVALVRKALAG